MEKKFGDLAKKHSAIKPFNAYTKEGSFTVTPPSAFSVKQLVTCSSKQARKLLSYNLAYKFKVLPLSISELIGIDVITLAGPEEYSPDFIQELKFVTGKEIKIVPVCADVLFQAIFDSYHGDDESLSHPLTLLKEADAKNGLIPEKNIYHSQPVVSFHPSSGEAAKFLSSLIEYAIARKASDLHILPREEGCSVKIRIDGELHTHTGIICSLILHQQLISRIKVLSSLDTTKRKEPQDGSFKVPTHMGTAYIRVSVIPTVYGEKAVLRINGCGNLISWTKLGLDAWTEEQLQSCMNSSEGIILFAGPTGSGKSTTMYAMMEYLSKNNLSLVSIEDPIEMHLKNVAQTGVSDLMSYEYYLRSILRQDPDVILIGEIRDEKSAKVAFQAALTGHLIISTVHARNVFEIIMRLTALGLDKLTISQALRLALCQRLLPSLCQACKVFDLYHSNKIGTELFQPVGCKECDYSGFLGRVLATECLVVDQIIEQLILEKELSLNKFKSVCKPNQYRPLSLSIQDLLKDGKISMVQALELGDFTDFKRE